VNEIRERIYDHVKDACFHVGQIFISLKSYLKLDKDFIDLHITEINTFEDQINKSIDLLQYTKRQLKSKKCQNSLKKIKEEYKLE
jgi:hypothetical protein